MKKVREMPLKVKRRRSAIPQAYELKSFFRFIFLRKLMKIRKKSNIDFRPIRAYILAPWVKRKVKYEAGVFGIILIIKLHFEIVTTVRKHKAI